MVLPSESMSNTRSPLFPRPLPMALLARITVTDSWSSLAGDSGEPEGMISARPEGVRVKPGRRSTEWLSLIR